MEVFEYRVLSSMNKVLPAREPSGGESGRELYGFKNETVSFQVAYFWGGRRKQRGTVSVETPDGVDATVRIVGLVPCSYPCHITRDDGYLFTEPGIYPDILTDVDEWGFPLIPGQWRSLWIDLNIDEQASSGMNTITVNLEIQSEEVGACSDLDAEGASLPEESRIWAAAEIGLHVSDAVLPALSIPRTEWLHCDCLADHYGVEVFSETHWEIIRNYIHTAVKRGCTMIYTPIFTPSLDTAEGGERTTVQLVDVSVTEQGYQFGYEKFERWVTMCKECGVRYFEMAHLFTQWGARYCPKIVGMKDGSMQKLFGWEVAASSPEYTDFLAQFLPSFTAELERLGIAKQSYFHISDEPRESDLESYRTAKSLVQDYLKGYHIIDAISDYDFYKEGLIQEPVCSSDHIRPFLENRPERLWTYYCTAQCMDVSNRYIALPGARTRILGIQMFKHNIDGFLHWGYNFYNSEYSLYSIDPFLTTDADGAFPSGDPFLVYPGKDGKPIESMRLMLMDEAMADFRALHYLEQLAGRECALRCLGEEGESLTFSSYPQRESYIMDVRRRVYEEIRRISG